MNNKTLHDPKTTKSIIISYTESLEAKLAKTGVTTLTAAEVTISKLELAEKFTLFTGRNIFLTGKAGTGKTTFLHRLKTELVFSPECMLHSGDRFFVRHRSADPFLLE